MATFDTPIHRDKICDWICKKGDYKYLEIPFGNIQFIIFQECMEQLACISPLIQDHSVDGLFNGILVKMPTILDSLFHKVVNTTSISIGWRVVGSHEMAGPSNTKTFLWPTGPNSGCFQFHMSQNVATSMPSLTSQSCSDSLLTVCLAGKVGAIYIPPKHPCTPDRPMNETSVKADR